MRVQHVHVHVLSRRCVSLADPKILHSLSRDRRRATRSRARDGARPETRSVRVRPVCACGGRIVRRSSLGFGQRSRSDSHDMFCQ